MQILAPQVATGKVFTRIGQLVIVTDRQDRFVAVGVVGKMNQNVCVTVSGEPDPTMVFKARWSGLIPEAGDYLCAKRRAKAAYRIVKIRVTGSEMSYSTIEMRVTRVSLPLPKRAVVHPWRWCNGGKNWGAKAPVDAETYNLLCERQLGLLRDLAARGGWVTPRQIGGSNSSFHYASLCLLYKKGLVARRRPSGRPRGKFHYMVTPTGAAYVQ